MESDRVSLLKKELEAMYDVRDIVVIKVQDDRIYFRIAFNVMPEWCHASDIYVDDEGYNQFQAFEWDGQWRWAIRRIAFLEAIGYEAIRDELV